MSVAVSAYAVVPRRRGIFARFFASRFVAVVVVVLAIVAIWYLGAFLLDAPFQRDLDQRAGVTRSPIEFVVATYSQKKPTLPAPHQVAVDTYNTVVLANPTKPSSLLFHAWVTFTSTFAGFISGTLLGILLAVGIVHVKSLDRSLMPWVISSQTIPILALAPIVVVVAFNLLSGQMHLPTDFSRFIAKALISTYLSFFPVTVGMVKGLRSPDPFHLDLMRTYSASPFQVFWKLRWPASLPMLFVSMKIAVAAALVGAIVAELPTGAVAGIGAKLLVGSYYSQSIQMWSALVVGSILAALLVTSVGIVERVMMWRMGGGAPVNPSVKTAEINWQGWIALIALVAVLAFPIVSADATPTYLLGEGSNGILAALLVAVAVFAGLVHRVSAVGNLIMFVGGLVAAGLAATALNGVAALAAGSDYSGWTKFAAAGGFWALVLIAWMLAWVAVKRLSATQPARPFGSLLLKIFIPLVFGATLIFLWEALVRGLAVPFVILPPPSAVWAKLVNSIAFFGPDGLVSGVLWNDFRQTFLKSVIAGYAIGCFSGFAVAVIADRVPFLGRGLLPVGNLVSALPIIGVAPIMVMWFGFDWPSKAAVVVAMTFFPMLINTLAGLEASDATQRDLMHTYAADYRQQFGMLRLPVALPFIFNALKINSTLAMIGAIVAEFFGSPTMGMGFRISTEVGRMNTDMVWAEIAVAAVAGSAFYGIVSLIERAATFWHPSFRQSR